MRKRKHPIEMFSTFLKVDEPSDSIGPAWLTDSRLKQNMTRISLAEPDAPEEYWTLYWLREALKDPQNTQARSHLSAYLEEVCYWTTFKVFQEVANISQSRVDCFFIARAAAANPAKLFKNYDRVRSSLKTFAQFPLKTAILEEIRAGRELLKYSDPALLRAVTRKTLKEALQKAGLREAEQSQCLLAWQCFKEIYVPATEGRSKQLKSPDETQLAAMAEGYNQVRKNSLAAADSQSFKKLLDQCVGSVRGSLRINTISLENCVFEPALASDDPIDALDEPAQEWQQIHSIISEALAKVQDPNQKMLKLWHGLAFRQSELGQIFGQKQYQISRQISRCQQSLLTVLAEWSASTLGITLSSDQLKEMANQIEAWLDSHFQSFYFEVLKTAVQAELPAEIELLRLYYGQDLKPQDVARELQIPESVVNQRLGRVKQHLLAQLRSHVQTTLGLDLSSVSSADKRLSAFVGTFLEKAPYAVFE
ncbi:sigma-70 family RNA polymerase sigma factor [Kamptonema formosum]|uniref:sigma-70 family RNA polymerase sigma factor n=1 Tax=Kamptonema formosum TaxID=331992 RepID=UPI00034D5F51|nr:sigma-70 family RNA polymerase sigma factor [Oscillatoria sp. PCC 10802]